MLCAGANWCLRCATNYYPRAFSTHALCDHFESVTSTFEFILMYHSHFEVYCALVRCINICKPIFHNFVYYCHKKHLNLYIYFYKIDRFRRHGYDKITLWLQSLSIIAHIISLQKITKIYIYIASVFVINTQDCSIHSLKQSTMVIRYKT